MFTAGNLIGGLLFSSIGLVAFLYGKKQGLWKPMVLGLVLAIYPYFIGNEWLMFGIGALLTVALFVFRD